MAGDSSKFLPKLFLRLRRVFAHDEHHWLGSGTAVVGVAGFQGAIDLLLRFLTKKTKRGHPISNY
jgi:hypothetical protein